MQSRVFVVLALLITLSFSLRSHAEVVKIAVLSTQDFHASMKQWQSTANYLSSKLPQHVFQVLPYSNTADLKTDLRKNKLDFLLTGNSELSQFVAEFAFIPVLNAGSKKQQNQWVLSRNKQLSYQLTYSISDVLLKLPASHKALKQSAIANWTLSDNTVSISSSQKVQQLYTTSAELAAALFKQYWSILLAILLSGLLILAYQKWDRYHREQLVKKHRAQRNDPSLSDTVF